jgi:hypothetical protein
MDAIILIAIITTIILIAMYTFYVIYADQLRTIMALRAAQGVKWYDWRTTI